jgi:GNAT superfamily N-acetyltransferase
MSKYINTFNSFKKPKIEEISSDDIDEIVDMASIIFSNVMSYDDNQEYIREVTHFDLSSKLTLNGKIIGCYLVAPKVLDGDKGLEGIALAVKPEFRGKGFGELLKDWFENYAKSNGYKFVFGQHLKGLHNIDNWLKRRELHSEDAHSYYTIKRF